MSLNVKIYSTQSCPYCVRAKAFFKSKNIAFEEIDLTGKSEEIDALKKRTGHMTVPQIFINGDFVGGYSDMMEKIESGTLKL